MSPVPITTGSHDFIWNGWTSATAANYTTSYLIRTRDKNWLTWVGTGALTSSTTTTGISNSWTTKYDDSWRQWVTAGHVTYSTGANTFLPTRMPTEAELAERQVRRDQLQTMREAESRRALALKPRVEGAQDRALGLLESLLTPAEAAHWAEYREIKVRALSGRLYTIANHGVHGNIYEVDEHGCKLATLCVAPAMWDAEEAHALPTADGWVGQYLAIKFNEEHLRATANWSNRRGCAHVEGAPVAA